MAKSTTLPKALKQKKTVETLTHNEAKRKNIPTAEYQSVMRVEEQTPIRVAYERRNRDLDPQLVWRGKDEKDWSDLVVPAPPLYIQEKVHPKVLIDDLRRQSETKRGNRDSQFDLFANFNGLPSADAKTEFYQHDAHWSNRMILGDSLQVMASLAEREGLRSKVQCIYIDPPYGIKFNSNFQWSTTSRDVKDGNLDHITREPEQVKAFRDTWRDGIHSYLTYLRDRLTVARDLLTESGSIFVQIGDENVHLVRSVLDEVFGDDNFISLISVQTTTGFEATYLGNMSDFILWYAKKKEAGKSNPPLYRKQFELGEGNARWLLLDDWSYRGVSAKEKRGEVPIPAGARPYKPDNIISQGRSKEPQPFEFRGETYDTWEKNPHWKANYPDGMKRLAKASRIHVAENSIQYIRFHTDFDAAIHGNIWTDTGSGNFTDEKVYVVQTNTKVIERCILMATMPGDLVLDPTCGSGTTAYVCEQWGRRWITIDTSRVALALVRARVMGARYPYYLLADSREGQLKEASIRRVEPSTSPVHGSIRQGFVYDRLPHVKLGQIANNIEIDVIWDEYQLVMEPLRAQFNQALKKSWEEWEIPREADEKWPQSIKDLHAEWWKQRIVRQSAIDASIAAKADSEYLYDKPYEDNKKVRVAGPFTVESLSPHRVLAVDADEELFETTGTSDVDARDAQDFVQVILNTLKISGVQQAHKDDKITFSSIAPWPGDRVCAEGRYMEQDGTEKRAAIFIGPEFGTVSRPDLVSAAREAGDADFDVLITCAFNYDAHSSEFNKLGRIPVLKARMNADLHMAGDLKNTGKGNLFVIFGEPDIEILDAKNGQIQVKVNGVDVFHPSTGEVRSDGPDGIACWFVDTEYNEESFFVRQAYFLGANDPYKALKTTLKAEINEEAWETLHSDTSRPFDKPVSGRIAVKVINHLGDEVMKVFNVS
jgi:adenine-specific DNA-methyltransferase